MCRIWVADSQEEVYRLGRTTWGQAANSAAAAEDHTKTGRVAAASTKGGQSLQGCSGGGFNGGGGVEVFDGSNEMEKNGGEGPKTFGCMHFWLPIFVSWILLCPSGNFGNYYGDYPRKNPENHPLAESCTINSKLKKSNI